MATWEDCFRSWAGGPGDTERNLCENAERMIRKAVAANDELKDMQIEVFSQGSFKNVTNIPQESDVDLSVCLTDYMYYELPSGTEPSDFNITPGNREFAPYKKAVAKAMKVYFGDENVTVGNKAILIHSNTYRVDADVVANWLYREHFDVADQSSIREGVKFQADDGNWIVNYPKQHIEQGVRKNGNTSKRFKRLARILKSLQVEMLDKKIVSARLPSFLLESLVYNVPNNQFNHAAYEDDVRAVLAFIFNNTKPADDASKWVEVNDVKYLFHSTQPWTKSQAHAFVAAAWDHVGFK